MKLFKAIVPIIVILLFITPQSVFAYSYGDPNKEDLAEAYTFMKTKLDNNPADWDAAFQQYLVYKKVIGLEFGGKVTTALEADFKAKDKDLLKANYRGMLAMNLKRRFDNAIKEITNYSQAKLLLAKAKGTYEILSPYVKEKKTDTAVRNAFESAIEALGNPGLFGVGKIETDKAEFIKQTDLIYDSVKPLFPFVNSTAKEPAGSTSDDASKEQQAAGTADNAAPSKVKPEADTEKKPTSPAQSDANKSSDGNSDANSESTAGQSGEGSSNAGADGDADGEDGAAAAGTEQEQAATAPDGEGQDGAGAGTGQEADPTDGETASGSGSGNSGDSAMDSGTAPQDESTAESGEQGNSGSAEESDDFAAASDLSDQAESKVNPLVSMLVIGSVVIAAGAIIFVASKKGLFRS